MKANFRTGRPCRTKIPLTITLAVLVVTTRSASVTDGEAVASALVPAYENLGTWARLDTTSGPQGNTPSVFETPSDDAYDVWLDELQGKYTYEVAELGPDGGVLAPKASLFGPDYWAGLSSLATLVAQGPDPILIFQGDLGAKGTNPYSSNCVVAALGPKIPWTLQTWSLSHSCYNPNPDATETATGQFSAAWGGSVDAKQAVIYHLGAGATIPAGSPDSYFFTPGGGIANGVATAADVSGTDDVYVAFAESDAKVNALNGYYVKDVTTNGPLMRAPGSGADSSNDLPTDGAKIAMASTNAHSGAYLLYCANGPSCPHLLLWRVGTTTAGVVPGSADAFHYAVSAGSDGRLWLAWYNHSTNDVSTVRTSMDDHEFGPVETYTTPCDEDGLLGLSGGDWGRLDVALECVDNKSLRLEELATQSLTALAVSPGSAQVNDGATFVVGHQTTFTVTDAGDPVAGAKVHADGQLGTTDAMGRVTLTFPDSTAVGTHPVVVSADNYIPAEASLTVVNHPGH
jgi:hypothetical protein